MIDTTTYRERRDAIRHLAGDGCIFLPGHRLLPRNYPDNVYPFRQNSHFLYFAGIDLPGLALVVGKTAADDLLFGPPEDLDDVVWHGPHETMEQAAVRVGVEGFRDIATLGGFLRDQRGLGYLSPYQHSVRNWMAELLGSTPDIVAEGASADLARAVVVLRSVKSADEIAEIENALDVTREMHLVSMRATRPGVKESTVAGAVQHVALSADRAQAYNPIITVHGEVLHNNSYHNTLEAGQLLLNDSGAESPLYYASDITRACPVDGKFSAEQRGIYDAVLRSQLAAIEAVRPGVPFRDLHLLACRVITEGLVDVGLMRGSVDDAVAAGAHALFFPHGLGHMLGLDVHDMEDLGDLVGYEEGTPRSAQFGLNFLRLQRPLAPGNVFTVEPGVYFIPALMDRWRAEGTNAEFIDFDAVDRYRDFGGIRIEDDVLCTDDGGRILGSPIAKTAEEVEAVMAA